VALSTDQYLTHHWPIENGTARDKIGSTFMSHGSLTSFVEDRFCNPNSALALNGGWTQIQSGIYFNTPEFTISVWIYPLNVSWHSRVLDFGNGPNADNFIFSLLSSTLQPYINIYSGSSFVYGLGSKEVLTEGQWQFHVITINGTNARMYLNGKLVANSINPNLSLPTNESRSKCYIGKSHWASEGYSHSYLDDLRFYNKSFTQKEILELMNQNETGRKYINDIIII
jgi:hypothetical protein